jgi:Uma2 family endonuclease
MLSHSCNYSIISHKDYLEGEKVSPIKHEYIRGEVYAMAGGSDAHETIAGNLFVLLRNHVRSRGCRAYIGNMKVKIDDQNPDDFKQYPCLIVEVLSPSTEAFNRGNKFADYRQIETLEEYVLISQDQINVECFRRNKEGRWVLYPYSKEDELELASIGFKCAIIELYEDVLGLN